MSSNRRFRNNAPYHLHHFSIYKILDVEPDSELLVGQEDISQIEFSIDIDLSYSTLC